MMLHGMIREVMKRYAISRSPMGFQPAAVAPGPLLESAAAKQEERPEAQGPMFFEAAGDVFDETGLLEDDFYYHPGDALAPPEPALHEASAERRVPPMFTEESQQATSYGIHAGDPRTTVMLQRIGFDHTELSLMCALDASGFRETYDAVYVPRNRKKNTNLGYGFVNFTHPMYAAQIMALFHDRPLAEDPAERTCKVVYSTKQGASFVRACAQAVLQRQLGNPPGQR